MRLLISVLLFFVGPCLWSQTEFVRVFTDQVILSRISTNGSLIAAVGQRNERQIAVKTLNYQGELLGGNTDLYEYVSEYDDVIVFDDDKIVASANCYTSLASGGPFTGSTVRVYNAAAELTSYNFINTWTELGARTCQVVPVLDDRFLYSSAGSLTYAQLNNGGPPILIADTTFESYPFPEYHFLENWQDNLAVLVSNALDSLFLREFTGELVRGVALDEDVAATCLVGNTLWLTDDVHLYQYTLPALELAQTIPLPAASSTWGLEWIADEEKLLVFERENFGNSHFWRLDPASGQWEDLGNVVLPNAELLDMIYYQGSYLFCGSYLNLFGETTSFVGKSGNPIFEFPVPATDVGIKAHLELIDTSYFFDSSVEEHLISRTWDLEVILTNNSTDPVDGIAWKSDAYRKHFSYPTSYFEQLQDTLQGQLLPGDSTSMTVQFTTEALADAQLDLEEQLIAPYTICVHAKAVEDFGDYLPEDNVFCPTWEAEPEMIEDPTDENLRMYPNPVEDRLYLEAKSPEMIKQWKISGTSGRIMSAEMMTTPVQETSIDLSSFSPGLYWIGVQTTEKETWYSFFVR